MSRTRLTIDIDLMARCDKRVYENDSERDFKYFTTLFNANMKNL